MKYKAIIMKTNEEIVPVSDAYFGKYDLSKLNGDCSLYKFRY